MPTFAYVKNERKVHEVKGANAGACVSRRAHAIFSSDPCTLSSRTTDLQDRGRDQAVHGSVSRWRRLEAIPRSGAFALRHPDTDRSPTGRDQLPQVDSPRGGCRLLVLFRSFESPRGVRLAISQEFEDIHRIDSGTVPAFAE